MRYLMAALVVLLLAVIAFSKHQNGRIQEFTSTQQEMQKKIIQAQADLTSVIDQYNLINGELENVAKQKKLAESDSEKLRSSLKKLQSTNQCVNVPVPVDVIRMQRDAINKTNSMPSNP